MPTVLQRLQLQQPVMRLKADLLLFMVAIIWGSAFVAQDIAGQYGVAYLYNGICFVLASLILIPFIPRGSHISKSQYLWMAAAGGILFVATAAQQVGLLYTKVANASFITSLYCVFTPFLLWFWFRERPHRLDMVAIVTASIGAYFLSTGGEFDVQKGDVIELLGAIFWAWHFVVLGKFASRFDSISFAAGHFFVCGLLNLLVGLFVEDAHVLTAWPMLGSIAYRATLSIGIGYTLQVWGQKYTPPSDAALILGLEAVFAVAAAYLALSQNLLFVQICGCALIFIAVIVSQLKVTVAPKAMSLGPINNAGLQPVSLENQG